MRPHFLIMALLPGLSLFPFPATSQNVQIVSVSSGTGFFIDNLGHALTNHHVISSCSTYMLRTGPETYAEAELVSSDKDNDIALLKTDAKVPAYAYFRQNEPELEKGDPIYTLGYAGEQGAMTNTAVFTAGKYGIQDEFNALMKTFQFTPMVGHGNSGGPALDREGNVIGIVKMARTTLYEDNATIWEQGDKTPYTVAVNWQETMNFLRDNYILHTGYPMGTTDPGQIEQNARAYTVQVVCK